MQRLLCAVTTVIMALFISGSIAQAQSSGFQSGTQKYREKNPAGGKGRSGGATMAARMLYGNDGTTDLEVTTGEFDSTAPPTGELTKLRVTAYDSNGIEMFSYGYQPAGATSYHVSYTGFSPGQPFTVHGHIRSDVKRNTSVIVTTSVQKRPDLYADRIVMPSRVPVGIPVQVVGVVKELNGQIGARTNCVLYADDVEIDRSNAIWVDSADTVSCAFSPTFNSVGIVNLKVKAESVVPGDWDTANNVAERTIEVMSLTPEFDAAAVEAAVEDTNNATFRQAGRYVNSTLTSGYDWFYEETVDQPQDAFVYAAAALFITEVPSQITATATDGTASWTLQRAVPGCFDYAVGRVNGRSYYTYVTGCGNLYVEIGSYAGTVTYASKLLKRTFQVVAGAPKYDGDAEYIFNNVTTEVANGENLFRGSTWTIDVSVVAGPFTFSAPVTVGLNQTFDDGRIEPYTCTTTSTSVWCNQSSWRVAGRYGTARVDRQQP